VQLHIGWKLQPGSVVEAALGAAGFNHMLVPAVAEE
jgi:hypothetical protein